MPRKEIKLCRANLRQSRALRGAGPRTRHSPALGIVAQRVRRGELGNTAVAHRLTHMPRSA